MTQKNQRPSVLGAVVGGLLDFGASAAKAAARSNVAPARKKKIGGGCTPCAAVKTGSKMWNKIDKQLGLNRG